MFQEWEPDDSMYENDDWQDYGDDFDTYGEELDSLQNDQWLVRKVHDDDFWENFDEEYDSYDDSEEGEWCKQQMIFDEFGSYDNYLSELSDYQRRTEGSEDDENPMEDDSFWGVDMDEDDMPF